MKYSAILIDADDTLFDFSAAEENAISEVLAMLGVVDPGAPAIYHALNTACWRDLELGLITQAELKIRRFRELIKLYALDAEPADVSEMYIQALSEQSILLPNALDALKIVSQSRPVAIVTNGIARVQRGRMALSPVADYIQAFVISEEAGSAKPDAAIFQMALKALGNIPPEKALMIGDSLSSDMTGANAAGIDACWYNPGHKPRIDGIHIQYEISDIREIPDIALL